MVRIGLMAHRISVPDRRTVLTALGAAALAPAFARVSHAEAPPPVVLRAMAATISLRPGQAETPVWQLQPDPPKGPATSAALRLKRSDQVTITLKNDLPVPCVPYWRGMDVASAVAAVPPGANSSFALPVSRAGTSFCDLRLFGDGEGRPWRPLPVVVEESEATTADRDEVFLVEDWRLRADGTAFLPGLETKDLASAYTVNGRISPDFAVRHNERLRLRVINGCQRAVIALKIEGQEVRVMALDGEPAEPFVARNGALVLAPGGRADVFIDAGGQSGSISQILLHDGQEARPIARLTISDPPMRPAPLPPAPVLPANGLPAELDLKSALRVELPLNGAEWMWPANFTALAARAFRAKAGRIVVATLTNRADIATVFHLHGHHFRLLDRLDDGWKPFWLDTLAVEPGQTQRIAFAAEHAGRWVMESIATDWAAPRLVRWYAVE
jgi:FtsP/CotA-like multicopper oxidase with cupredoxin domain